MIFRSSNGVQPLVTLILPWLRSRTQSISWTVERDRVQSNQATQTDISKALRVVETRNPTKKTMLPMRYPTLQLPPFFRCCFICYGERYADLRNGQNSTTATMQQAWIRLHRGRRRRFPPCTFHNPFRGAKLRLLWQLVQSRHNEWFILADCDALYTRMNETIAHLLADFEIRANDSHVIHVVVAQTLEVLHSMRVSLVRNTAWSKQFWQVFY